MSTVVAALITLAGLVLVYGFLIRHLPIHDEEPLPESGPEPVGAVRTAESVS